MAFAVRWDGLDQTVIEGRDRCGWTLDQYVLPRMSSGLYRAREIDLSHDVMRTSEAAEPFGDHGGRAMTEPVGLHRGRQAFQRRQRAEAIARVRDSGAGGRAAAT